MRLGNFHRLISGFRSDLNIPERTFIGRLIDTAQHSNSVDQDIELDELKQHYHNTMKHIYSTNYKKPPLSYIKAKSIYFQKNENFWDIVEYFINTIGDLNKLKAIIEQITVQDKLQCNDATFYWEPPVYRNFISEFEKSREYFAYTVNQVTKAYSIFLAEFFYYTIFQEITGDVFWGRRFLPQEFDYLGIIKKIDHEFLSQSPYTWIKNGKTAIISDYIEISESIDLKSHQFKIPYGFRDNIVYELKNIILNDDYVVLICQNYILIYRKGIEHIFRIIDKNNTSEDIDCSASFLDATFVYDEYDNTFLLTVTNAYYLKVNLSAIALKFPKNANNKEIDDFEILSISDSLKNALENVHFEQGKLSYYCQYNTSIIFFQEDVLNNQVTSKTLLSSLNNITCKECCISPNGQYLLMIENNNTIFVINITENTSTPRYIIIKHDSAQSIDIFLNLKSNNNESIDKYLFSPDSKFLIFSYKQNEKEKIDVLNLQTMENKTISFDYDLYNVNNDCILGVKYKEKLYDSKQLYFKDIFSVHDIK